MLYLETDTIPITDVMISIRLNYLHTLVGRLDDELTMKVNNALKECPIPGDWFQLVAKDKENVQLHMDHLKQI